METGAADNSLQPLALHYQSRQAHAPFFRPLFHRLRTAPETGCSDDLTDALRRFLDAPSLNQRTHDNKTLILASRLSEPVTMAEAEAVADRAGPMPACPLLGKTRVTRLYSDPVRRSTWVSPWDAVAKAQSMKIVGRPGFVAKIYHQPISADQTLKLDSIASRAIPAC